MGLDKRKAIILLVVIGALLYANSLLNGFVWDDEEQIVNNSLVHTLANWPSFFGGGAFNSGGAAKLVGIYYKPVMTLTFSVIYSLFGPNPFFFHLVSLAIHIANSVLVFLLLSYFLTRAFKKEDFSFPAFFASLLFLVHPIYSEVVFYAANIQDALYFFFGASGLFVAVKKKLTWRVGIAVTILFLASLLSKETGVVFAGLAVLWAVLFSPKNIMGLIYVAASALGIYLFLRLGVAGIGFSRYEIAPIANLPFLQRLANMPKLILYYLQTTLFPQNLVANQHWVISGLSFREFYLPLIASLMFFITLIAFGVYLVVKKSQLAKMYFFFSVWFIASLALHLQIFPLDVTASGRWFYLPMAGLLGILFLLFSSRNLRAAVIFLLPVVIIFSAQTFLRSFDWRSGLTLYAHDAAASPGNFNLENNLGVELYRIGKFDEAKVHFENSTELAPAWWTNWNNLGAIMEKNGNLTRAGEYYQKAVDNGGYYLAYENLANLYLIQNKPEEAQKFAAESLKLLPQNSKLWFTLAIAQYKLGQKTEALASAKNAYLISPDQRTEYVYSRLINNLPLELKQ